MCKFESSQKDESRAQSADSSKAYRNLELLIVAWARFKLKIDTNSSSFQTKPLFSVTFDTTLDCQNTLLRRRANLTLNLQ